MEAVFYYLLKVSIATAVFYGTYYFLLRNTKQFVFNRIYLAGSFLAAFFIPLITFQTTSRLSQATTYFSGNVSADVLLPPTTVTVTETYSSITTFLIGLYLCGVVYFLVKLIYGYTVAAAIRKSCTRKKVGDLEVLVSEQDNQAFTFLNKIIIGKNLLNHPALEMVLKHEAVHSHEQHFYDIILAELLLLLQWFNPFARFHAQAIRNNLEFRADEVVIQAADKKGYQMTMLGMALNSINSTLFTALNSSNLKKRIVMMNSKNRNQFAGIARFAIIPVVALLLVSLSGRETIILNDSGMGPDTIIQKVNGEQAAQNDPIKSEEDIYRFFSKSLKYPAEARKAGQIGSVGLFAIVNPDGTINEVSEVQPEGHFVEFDEVVIVGYTSGESEKPKLNKSAKHEILIQEGKRVISTFPKLEIPALQGKVVKFTFEFKIRYERKEKLKSISIPAQVKY